MERKVNLGLAEAV